MLAFSFYLSNRVLQLLLIAVEITDDLDKGFGTNPVDGTRVGRASTMMWLWTLGAYEVVRTMCQAKTCFSPNAMVQLEELKRYLASVRMPDAKMEKPSRRVPVNSNRSPDGWDLEKRDLLLGDPKAPVSARFLLGELDRVMSAMQKTDVLAQHCGRKMKTLSVWLAYVISRRREAVCPPPNQCVEPIWPTGAQAWAWW
ncbi:MAG: hypothetical protein V1844_19280 [Pseudomonadota bacterium]|jgi:hypothetical protein